MPRTDAVARAGAGPLRRAALPLATVAGLGAATLAVALRDPHVRGSWGLCPSAALGFDCPGCGGLRAVHDLAHGHLLAAASSNLYLVAALPVVVAVLAAWVLGAWRGPDHDDHVAAAFAPLATPLVTLALVTLAAFTVLRNLPGLGWLAA
ncbi:DUF2752 domain-containing protein [Nocardioides marinquilinus]|uniref:DUF2752 domain-containing protein n=1 Tax=Nocardioides marinquilinus TaxID=1210400 RepID=UPI0031EF326C